MLQSKIKTNDRGKDGFLKKNIDNFINNDNISQRSVKNNLVNEMSNGDSVNVKNNDESVSQGTLNINNSQILAHNLAKDFDFVQVILNEYN